MIVREEPAEYNPWLRLIFLIPAVSFAGAIWMAYSHDLEGTIFLAGEGFLFGLFFYFILPRKYQIFQDKLRIELGRPFAINIPFAAIREVKQANTVNAYLYSGVRFVTSTRYVIEIVRSGGFNYVISPQRGESFLEQLRSSVAGYPRLHR